MTASQLLCATTVDALSSELLLRFWHWLVPDGFRILCVTRIGDAFLEAPDSAIWWLDVGQAHFEPVARNEADWLSRLEDSTLLNDWSARLLVEKIEAAGLSAPEGHCFTYLQCPILGGLYEPDNFKSVPIQQHFNIWGPIHEKLRGLPDGTHVRFEVVE